MDHPSLTVEESSARRLAWAAIAAAAIPHFFLQLPVEFYEQGNTSAWLGLTVWAPAFLGAIAIFVGAAPNARTDSPVLDSADTRIAAGLCVPIAVVVGLAAINFDGYQRIGEVGALARAMATYAGVFAVGVLFWQSLFQKIALASLPALLRPLVVTAAATALWLPFLHEYDIARLGETLGEYALVHAALAILFELGLPAIGCVGAAVLIGIGWGWAHQMTFFF